MSNGLPAVAVEGFTIAVRHRGLSPLRLLVALIALIGSAVSGAEAGVATIDLESAAAVAVDGDIPAPIGYEQHDADRAFDYDASSIACASCVEVVASPSSPSQITGHREEFGYAAASPRSAPTTAVSIFVAPQPTPPGNRAIVIGEDMEGRVIPHARELGADYYDPPPAPRSQWMENNRQWINDRMDEGCTIYNCGPAPGRANYPNPTSPYFQMELDEIAKRNYPTRELP